MTTSRLHDGVSVEDHLFVLNILGRYAHLLDDRDMEECATLFHPDCVLTFDATPYAGIAEIRRWQKSLLAQPPGRHMVAGPVVWREDGTLHAVADFTFTKKIDGTWTTVACGRWHDTFAEGTGGLTFASRDVVLA
jgi:3-phenylpropionate/cinnamic acid dioxygenase small subunit